MIPSNSIVGPTHYKYWRGPGPLRHPHDRRLCLYSGVRYRGRRSA